LSTSDSQRIDELESRLTFLDDTVEQLDSVIARQDHDIRVMQQRLSELVAKLDDLGDSVAEEGGGSQHEIPPHY
jgi:SlyX protein